MSMWLTPRDLGCPAQVSKLVIPMDCGFLTRPETLHKQKGGWYRMTILEERKKCLNHMKHIPREHRLPRKKTVDMKDIVWKHPETGDIIYAP